MESAIDNRPPEEPEAAEDARIPEAAWRPGVRFTLAVLLAGAIALGIHEVLPRTLVAHTDVVGYPLYADFNVNNYFDDYYLAAIVFPLLAILFGHLLGKVGALRRPKMPRRERFGPTATVPTPDEEPSNLASALRTVLPGSVAGIECAAALGLDHGAILLAVILGALSYALVAGIAWFVFRRVGPPWNRVSRPSFNIVATLVVVPLLAFVSARTVVVTTAGHVEHYPWLPLWVAIVATLAVLVGARIALRRGRSAARIERALLAYVVAPIGLFVLLASLPGNLAPMDAFGEGEYLAGGWLMLHGALPWRDLLQIHGVFDDGLKAILGFEVFGKSRWGASAGIAMFLLPAYWVSTYVFAASLFARRASAIVISAVGVCCGVFVDWDPRYLFWPLVLVLFAAVLRSPRRITALALGVVLVAQSALIPEMSYALIALGAVLFGFECYERPVGSFQLRQFPRTSGALAGIAGSGVVFAAYLVATGSVAGFVGYFEDFATAHSISGGIPLFTSYSLPGRRDSLGIFHFIATRGGYLTRYTAELYLPVLLMLATVLLVAWKVRSRRVLSVENWVAIGAAGFVALYYQKGISRGDDFHIGCSFAVSVPLLLLLGHEVLTAADGAAAQALRWVAGSFRHFRSVGAHPITRWRVAYPAMLAALAVVAVIAPLNPLTVVEAAGTRLQPVGASSGPPPVVPGGPTLGYGGDGALPQHLVSDLGRIFRTYAGSHGAVFDFSDAPAIVDFLLDRNPASRYYDVSLAITASAQQDAVRDLERSRPKLVLFSGVAGLPYWDFIENEVRQYVIARYVLDHYRPLVLVDGELVLISDSLRQVPALPKLSGQPVTTGLYFSQPTCAFGYIPSFLALPPGSTSGGGTSARPVEVADLGRQGRYYRLSIPGGTGRYSFLAVTRTGGPSAAELEVTPAIERTRRPLSSEITWATVGAGRAALEVGSCLQWHGLSTVYLRYIGPGSPTSVALYP